MMTPGPRPPGVERLLLGALLGLCLAPGPAWGQQPREPEPSDVDAPETSAARPPDGRRTLGRLPSNFGRGLVGVWSRRSVPTLAIGTTLTVASSFLDEDVREALSDPSNDFGQRLETGGGAVITSVVVGGLFVSGRLAHGPRFRSMSYDMLVSVLVTGAYTGVLKAAVGRERPNMENNKSFPSGHASNAFSMAVIAQHHYGWKVGAPAYLVAGLIAGSRLQRDKHWLSDVVSGATLGLIVGHTVAHANDAPLPDETRTARRATLSVTPLLARGGIGVQLSGSF